MYKDLKSLTLSQLKTLMTDLKGKSFWAGYLFSFIQAQNVRSIDEITPLPKTFRQQLVATGYGISCLKTIEVLTDPDGTQKFLFERDGGGRFESVVLKDGDRHTACISCQVGCRMGCRFCATGQLQYQGNLSAGEIADQVNQIIAAGVPLHNLVYMGMGEPLDNLDAVLNSIRILNDNQGHNIGQRHITVSTCGIPSGILELAQTGLQVRLALSLHAPSDSLRQEIMPIAQRYPLREVLEAVRQYQRSTKRRVTIEYCMIEGLNDSPAQAKELLACLKGIRAHINLIEYNNFPDSPFEASSRNTIERFAGILHAGGLETVVRYKRGRTINAACGQLGADRLQPKQD